MEKNNEIVRIEKEVPAILEHARKIKILTDGDIKPVAEFMQEIKKKQKQIEDFMNPAIASADKTHKLLISKRDISLAKFKDAMAECKSKIAEYHLRKQEEAQKLQEKLQLQQQREIAKKVERLQNRAELEREKGNMEKAEEYESKAEDIEFITPSIRVSEPETKFKDENGNATLTITKDFDIAVINFDNVLKSVLEKKLPVSTIKIIESEIKKYIKSMALSNIDCFNLGIAKTEKLKTIVRGRK